MKYKKTVKFISFSAAFFYLLASFVQAGLDFTLWTNDARFFTALLFGFTVFFGLAHILVMDENDEFE